jgi:hypothetical protein
VTVDTQRNLTEDYMLGIRGDCLEESISITDSGAMPTDHLVVHSGAGCLACSGCFCGFGGPCGMTQ